MKLKDVVALLKMAGIEEAQKEAETLLSVLSGLDRTAIYLNDPAIGDDIILPLIRNRQRRQPLAYIVGEVEFYGLTIAVGPGVLIPRPETELLVAEAIGELSVRPQRAFNVLDLCTGSGCIALSIARAYPQAHVTAVDVSEAALHYARGNSNINHIHNVTFLNGNLFAPIRKDSRFNLIISNPPYIKSADINGLQPEISLHEPPEALDGGSDGLDFYRRILAAAGDYLNRDGVVIFEIGDGQGADITEIASEVGFNSVVIKRDYAQKERFAIVKKQTQNALWQKRESLTPNLY
ncbi:MAG: peptide chain release factor N(5)-glutamine methyltransferase [Nitrospirae bacterium]|uniref:peptide chain release factor N(5)-glutamine methyltransferase n=1 Tax=Candidatus Magnetobacterium casense TaxID=1455061 RepID=UPI0006990C58|nr:peptide chain release factor N(5)-glutamine methyltransferase [Candidatus Magnetobacterium casensis]MBF0338277.1 peptide chain release factor N(5)-glutamine methyltransferase [Nitrospirota bacterium]